MEASKVRSTLVPAGHSRGHRVLRVMRSCGWVARRCRIVSLWAVTGLLAACGSSSGTPEPTTVSDQPPGAPADLWRAPATKLPASANYVYLLDKSIAGREREFVYTAASSVLEFASSSARLTVTVRGDESWFGEMQSPAGVSSLARSYHEGLQRFPTHDPARGGLQWWGITALCEGLEGWVAIDSASYIDGALAAVEARFEQRCPTGESLLGQVRWRADDATRPADPQPIPAGLWQPPTGRFPVEGNAVYIHSDRDDPLGNGVEATYTPLDASMWSDSLGGYFSLHLRGERYWDGQFQAMSHLSRLRVGFYDDLRRYPFHNPARGGLTWSDPQLFCNLDSGWMAVDDIHYADAGWIDSIELRFEQRCEGATGALRGKLRWSAFDTTQAAGPAPVPDTLWRPDEASMPASSSYVYLESSGDDPVGAGRSLVFEPPGASLGIDTAGGRLRWEVSDATSFATAEFLAMDSVTRIEAGYYAGLRRPGVHNPTRGALLMQVEGRACLDVESWVAVDKVVYVGATLAAIDLRFEQVCAGALGPLRGRLAWSAPVPDPPALAAETRALRAPAAPVQAIRSR